MPLDNNDTVARKALTVETQGGRKAVTHAGVDPRQPSTYKDAASEEALYALIYEFKKEGVSDEMFEESVSSFWVKKDHPTKAQTFLEWLKEELSIDSEPPTSVDINKWLKSHPYYRSMYGTHVVMSDDAYILQAGRERNKEEVKVNIIRDIPIAGEIHDKLQGDLVRVAVINGESGAGKTVAAMRVGADVRHSVTIYFLACDVTINDESKEYEKETDPNRRTKLAEKVTSKLADEIASNFVPGDLKEITSDSPDFTIFVVVDEIGVYPAMLRMLCAVGRDDERLSTAVASKCKLSVNNLKVRLVLAGTGVASYRFATGSAENGSVELFTAQSSTECEIFQSLMCQETVRNKLGLDAPKMSALCDDALSYPTVRAAVANPRVARFFTRDLLDRHLLGPDGTMSPVVVHSILFSAISRYKAVNGIRTLPRWELIEALSVALRLHFFPHSFAQNDVATVPPSVASSFGMLSDVAVWSKAIDDAYVYATTEGDNDTKQSLKVTKEQGSRFQLSPAIVVIAMQVVLGQFVLSRDTSGSALELGAMVITFLLCLATDNDDELNRLLKDPTWYFRRENHDFDKIGAWAESARRTTSAVFCQQPVGELTPTGMAAKTRDVKALSKALLGDFADKSSTKPYVGAWNSGNKAPFADVVICAHGTLRVIQGKDWKNDMQPQEWFRELYKMGHEGQKARAGFIADDISLDEYKALREHHKDLPSILPSAEFTDTGKERKNVPRSDLFEALCTGVTKEILVKIITFLKSKRAKRADLIEPAEGECHKPMAESIAEGITLAEYKSLLEHRTDLWSILPSAKEIFEGKTNYVPRSQLSKVLGTGVTRDTVVEIIQFLKPQWDYKTEGEWSAMFLREVLMPSLGCTKVLYGFFTSGGCVIPKDAFTGMDDVFHLEYKQFVGGEHNLVPAMVEPHCLPNVVDHPRGGMGSK